MSDVEASPERDDAPAENKVWFLRQNRLFAKASDGPVEGAEHIFKIALHPKKSLIFDQGDPSRLIFLVKRGRVRIVRLTADAKEITVAILGPGDVFGEDSLFASAPRTTMAVCMDETLLCTAKADDLFALLTDNPKLALNVAEMLSNRLGEASATIEDLAFARISDRLMHLFRRLAHDHGRPAEGGTLLDIRLTQTDLASLIGSTRETVSLEISTLAKAGRIGYDGRYVTLPENEANAND
ncbi:MAG: Crp/Fnr family transcriptional regulator [Candidatus Eremiobacteraeota bacterium]|nr:Crp/Fnr family transcriptional regulator [Candidatus Eremiobacteraeota bacterium]